MRLTKLSSFSFRKIGWKCRSR